MSHHGRPSKRGHSQVAPALSSQVDSIREAFVVIVPHQGRERILATGINS